MSEWALAPLTQTELQQELPMIRNSLLLAVAAAVIFLMMLRTPTSTLVPCMTLFRSGPSHGSNFSRASFARFPGHHFRPGFHHLHLHQHLRYSRILYYPRPIYTGYAACSATVAAADPGANTCNSLTKP